MAALTVLVALARLLNAWRAIKSFFKWCEGLILGKFSRAAGLFLRRVAPLGLLTSVGALMRGSAWGSVQSPTGLLKRLQSYMSSRVDMIGADDWIRKANWLFPINLVFELLCFLGVIWMSAVLARLTAAAFSRMASLTGLAKGEEN